MKIVFGILSAIAPAATVENLSQALGPDSIKLIHHDWTQQPDFRVRGANVEFVPEPEKTGWANWGLQLAIYKLMRVALERHRFDYFQLMTPACLPIRPSVQLAVHLQRTRADFYVDHVPLHVDAQVQMSHSYRVLAPADSLRYRALWRARQWYFGDHPPTENFANLSFPTTNRIADGGRNGALARLGKWMTDVAGSHAGFWHPYSDQFRCHVGCSWFGASRTGCEYLLEQAKHRRRQAWFSRISMPAEIMTPTLIANSGLQIAPSNYLLSTFEGARPRLFGMNDLGQLRDSERFFARKFPEDVDAPIRMAIREQLLEGRERASAKAALPAVVR